MFIIPEALDYGCHLRKHLIDQAKANGKILKMVHFLKINLDQVLTK